MKANDILKKFEYVSEASKHFTTGNIKQILKIEAQSGEYRFGAVEYFPTPKQDSYGTVYIDANGDVLGSAFSHPTKEGALHQLAEICSYFDPKKTYKGYADYGMIINKSMKLPV